MQQGRHVRYLAFAGKAGAGKSRAAEAARRALTEQFPGLRIEVVAFATVLKQIAATLTGLGEAYARTDEAKMGVTTLVRVDQGTVERCVSLLTDAPFHEDAPAEQFGPGATHATLRDGLRKGIDVISVPLTPGHRQVVGGDDVTFGRFLQLLGTQAMRAHIGDDVFVRYLDAHARGKPIDIAIIPDLRFRVEAEFIEAAGGITLRVIRPGQLQNGGALAGRDGAHASECELDAYPMPTVVNNMDERFDEVVAEFITWAFGDTGDNTADE